jgi:hypothetical protein
MPENRKPKRTTSKYAGIFKGGIDQEGVKKRQEQAKAGSGPRVALKPGTTQILQFWGNPIKNDPFFLEYKQHVWKEGTKRWFFVPCLGEEFGCTLDDDEDDTKAKIGHGFAAAVWNFKERKPMVLTGGTNMLSLIIYQYKRNPERFSHRTFEVARLDTPGPAQYDVSVAEERAIRLSEKTPIDLEKYLIGEAESYNKEVGTKRRGASTLDDEEEEEDGDYEDEEPSEEEMMDKDAWSWSELKEYAHDYMGVRINTTKRGELVDAILTKRRLRDPTAGDD